MSEAPRVDWRFATICAAVAAALFGTQGWLNAPESNPITYGFAMGRAVVAWGIWLALSPYIFRAGQTNPLGTDARLRWIWRHLWLAMGFAIVHSFLQTLIRDIVGIPAPGDFVDGFLGILVSNFAGDVLRYTLISLAYQAFAYHWQVRQRDRAAARLELDLAEAKLAALEGRLRPHFLFNTLNAIAALIRDDPASAEAMIGQLSDLLRASLKADPIREVTVTDELTLVAAYLAIEETRFQGRLTSLLEATETARYAYVPHLILQPLVENAVRHGISPRESGGSIWVRADQVGDRLVITVEDDGVGMGNAPPSLAGGGVGLGGVRSRLIHLYGREQTLDVRARLGSGTIVRIELPYRGADEPVVELRA
ncbi:MAG: sensor histidine kinase [bacterium]